MGEAENGNSSDEVDLWFSDDESVDKDGSDWGFKSSWTANLEPPPSQRASQDLQNILAKLGIAKEEAAAVYLLGPHLWRHSTPQVAYKLLVITYEPASLSISRMGRTKERGQSKAQRDHQCFFLDNSDKKGSRQMGRPVKVILESIGVFEQRLLQHREMIPVWLPTENIWMEVPRMTSIRDNFQLNRERLLKLVSSHYATAVKRLDKFSRKEDWNNARRVIVKEIHVLLLSLQIAKRGRIFDYACQPELGRLADGIDGPEIMRLSDGRNSRIQEAGGADGPSGPEYRRVQLQTSWKALVEPLMEKLEAACAVRLQIDEGEVVCTEGVLRLCDRMPPTQVILELLELHDRYEHTQRTLVAKCSSLRAKLERIRSTLETVDDLTTDQSGSEEAPEKRSHVIRLPIGLECEMEYTREEALGLLQNSETNAKTMLQSAEQDLVLLGRQLAATETSITCAQQCKLKLQVKIEKNRCMVDFLINVDDVKKHSAEKSIPGYYLDLVEYLEEERGDCHAHPVWMDKARESQLSFSSYADIFYKHMGSATFFEKNRDFENSKFRRNQAVSAMTAPYTKKDGLAHILREYCGEKNCSHLADVASSHSMVKFQLQFEPGKIGFRRRGDRIVQVEDDSQAQRHGVKLGWSIESIDGEPYTDDLLKTKKGGDIPYEIGFVEPVTRVAALSADNIAPRSFTVGTSRSTESLYNDAASFEEEYVRGLSIAVCRRMLAAFHIADNCSANKEHPVDLVNVPFDFDVARAAVAVVRFCTSHHRDRIYRLHTPDFAESPSPDQAAYDSARKLLLQELHAVPLKKYNDSTAWEHQLPHSCLKEQDLEALLGNVSAWDPQMKTCYGEDNLWIFKPKGMGRGKGIFVAECVHDITITGGLHHLFSDLGAKPDPSDSKTAVVDCDDDPVQVHSDSTTTREEAHQEGGYPSTKLGGYGLTHVETGWVAQKYIERPLLFEGRKKFDIRFMTLLSFVGNDQLDAAPGAPGPGNVDLPWAQAITGGAHAGGRLTCYSFEDSIMKICAADFNDENEADGELRHLTNHAVQEHHPLYEPETGVQDSAAACARGSLGSSIPAGVFLRKLGIQEPHASDEISSKEKGDGDRLDIPEAIYYDVLLPQMRALAHRVFRATPWERDWARDEGFYPTDVRFQLFGFDMMVDEDYRVWVIEVNQQPGLSAEGVPAMTRIMQKLLRGMFGILLDVERYDLICSHSSSSGPEANTERTDPARDWPASAAGWKPLTS